MSTEPTFITEDTQEYIDAYLKNPSKKPPVWLKSQILPVLAHQRIEAASARDYPTASRLSRAEQELRTYFQSAQNRARAVRSVHTTATPSNDLSSRLQETQQRYDTQIEQCRREREEAVADLRLAHEYELKELHEKWEGPEALKAFNKPSPQLLQLREIERRKVVLMDYDGAEETKRHVDMLEHEETERARERMGLAMQRNIEQVRGRQQMEIEAADRLTGKKLRHLEKERDLEIDTLERQVKKAKNRERNEPGTIRAKCKRAQRERSPRYEGDDVALASPRTFRQMYQLRAVNGVQKLQVGAMTVDDSPGTKSRRPVSVQRGKPP
jgi:hypothetical protein